MNRVAVQAQATLAEANEADVVLVGSGMETREFASDPALIGGLKTDRNHPVSDIREVLHSRIAASHEPMKPSRCQGGFAGFFLMIGKAVSTCPHKVSRGSAVVFRNHDKAHGEHLESDKNRASIVR
ncbi:hypothetical protein [uncultured Azohydromonas sp.]|uniref:hypothetical protein n=1 Tax=uncultured Azohydromonas sp. TaxID=487342 RepID=UPI002634BACE|nr:hypothetical protein [uncultured Azohydromonas sp.]